MSGRFSKQNLLDKLKDMSSKIAKKHGFTNQTGYSQVERKSTAENRAYGEWIMLNNLIYGIQSGYIGYGDE